jgi:hypothetical protein
VALFREARCEKTAMPSSSYLADKFPGCFFQAPQEALDWIPARKRELREKQATVIGTRSSGRNWCMRPLTPLGRARSVQFVTEERCSCGFFGAAIANKHFKNCI